MISKETGAAFQVACEFEIIAINLDQERNNYLIPTVVNGALACELFLKALIMVQHNIAAPQRGHKLNDLFALLDDSTQQKIQSKSNIVLWDTFIADASNAFVDWRYSHEKEALSISVLDLLRFAHALHGVSEESIMLCKGN